MTTPHAAAQSELVERFERLTRSAQWRPVGATQVQFPTHHPQGMVKIGERLYVSSVEIIERTQRFAEPRDGLDRSAGRGRGHLFEMDADGRLLRSITLGEGDIYHPGGIDFDGAQIWVPVAKYRPNSRAIVYRVDPASLRAEEAFRYPDHLGAIVHDRANRALYGVSWGSRRFYRWGYDAATNQVSGADAPPARLAQRNPAQYIDYQDCHMAAPGLALCSGLNAYRPRADLPRLALGGIELVDLAALRPRWQVPVELWTETGLPMTQNPFWIEPHGAGLRAWFMPEDDRSRLFVYDVTPR